MKASADFPEIFLYRAFVDMRKSINGLSQIVTEELGRNPCDGGLFVFMSRDRTRIKALYWDDTGFALWHKRLEKEKFQWLRKTTSSALQISCEKLDWLLSGLDIEEVKPHEKSRFDAFS